MLVELTSEHWPHQRLCDPHHAGRTGVHAEAKPGAAAARLQRDTAADTVFRCQVASLSASATYANTSAGGHSMSRSTTKSIICAPGRVWDPRSPREVKP